MSPRDVSGVALPFALLASCAFASPEDLPADVPAPVDRVDASASDLVDVPARVDLADAAPTDVIDASARMDIVDVLPTDIVDVLPTDIVDVLPTDIVDVPARPDIVDAPALRPPFVAGGGGLDEATAVAFDPVGHLVAGLQFAGTANVGGQSLLALGGSDAVVVSLGADDRLRWLQRVGSPGTDAVNAVSVDAAGNVYACGTLGARGAVGTLGIEPPDGAAEGWVASWSREGAFRWAVAVGGAGSQQPLGLSADIDGSLWVAGVFDTTLATRGASANTRGGSDVFLLRLDATTGTAGFARFFGSTGEESFGGLAARAGRGIALGINFQGSLELGGPTVTAVGGSDAVVARFDPAGTYRSQVLVTSGGAERLTAVALDDLGSACAAGTSFNSTVMVGSAAVSLGFSDAFVACVSAEGAPRYTAVFGASDPLGSVERVRSLAVSADGSLWIAGDTGASTLSLGPRTATGPRQAAGFVARLDRSGTALALEIATAPSTFAGIAASDGAWAIAGALDARGSFAGLGLPAPMGRDALLARIAR